MKTLVYAFSAALFTMALLYKQIVAHLGFDVSGVVRHGLLALATIVTVVSAAAIVNWLWKLNKPTAGVHVAPFVVIEDTGKLTNAADGLAELLIARVNHIKSEMDRSQRLLKTRENASQNEGDFLLDAPKKTDALMATLFASGDGGALELTVQGVDIGGLVSWFKRQVRPPTAKISFTANIDADAGVSIAGDIDALKIPDRATVWIPPSNQSLGHAVDQLAYRLYQHSLARTEPHVGDLELLEFQTMMQVLAQLEGEAAQRRSSEENRQLAEKAYTLLSGILSQFRGWPALTVVTGDTARRTARYETALSHYRTAMAAAQSAEKKDDAYIANLADRINQTELEIAALTTVETARISVDSSSLSKRKSVTDLSGAELAILRAGFAQIATGTGDVSLDTFRAIYVENRVAFDVGFLPWNRAFLLYAENAIRELQPNFNLACWDFEEFSMPEAFTDEKLPNGERNPLFRPVDVSLMGVVAKPSEEVKRASTTVRSLAFQRQTALQMKTFEEFSSLVENQLNNVRHVEVGGAMGVVIAAPLDPVFYAHACAVDRLWADWQAIHAVELAPSVTDVVLQPFVLRVGEVLDSKDLGYSYASSAN